MHPGLTFPSAWRVRDVYQVPGFMGDIMLPMAHGTPWRCDRTSQDASLSICPSLSDFDRTG